MSYGFKVWSVDSKQLKQVAGSKDDSLRRKLARRFKHDFAELDEMFEDTFEDGEPRAAEALRHIIDGTLPRGARGGMYFYAFELLVEHFGTPLDNSAVYPWSRPDLRPVNTALAKMGVPFEFEQLCNLTLPVKLPLPDDFPLAGWVKEAQVKKVAAAFEDARYKGRNAKTGQLVESIRGWFQEAAAQGRGLVGYYH